MAIARRPRRPKQARQMELDGTLKDARWAQIPELDDWRRDAQAKALARWQELAAARRKCMGGKACSKTATVWLVTWSNQEPNAVYCQAHWPDGEGKAIWSPQGWLPDGRALAETGWRPEGEWGQAGGEQRRVHRRRGDLGSEG
jgi:hypothetical protein